MVRITANTRLTALALPALRAVVLSALVRDLVARFGDGQIAVRVRGLDGDGEEKSGGDDGGG